jgi:hypothetical protein
MIPPPHRRQTFNDYAEHDAKGVLKKRQDEDERWVQRFIETLEGVLRRLGI